MSYEDDEGIGSYDLIDCNPNEDDGLAMMNENKNKTFHTKIVGVTFEGRQDILKTMNKLDVLLLKREPDNIYDKNAVSVWTMEGKQCGYLSKDIATDFAPAMDKGKRYIITVSDITGDGEKTNLGCNIKIVVNE